ncbi:unnamed protein product [Strongylus vulgaris]|uniref:Uncharacterized protein n=1 Tax=Strongylus vulgaris TaxID=40348 RepID=A0A3P7ILG4_STRVU|nr:unnamed protein product [Strongylus vulgaris]
MENDLVDIQPFDSGDTISEVFLNVKFASRGVTEASVEVSVLSIPQQVQNIEHSTAFIDQQLSNDALLGSKPFKTEASLPRTSSQIPVLDAHPSVITQKRGISLAAKSTQMGKESSASQEPANTFEMNNESNFAEDSASEIEPPVLDGPIIGSPQCEYKAGVDMPPTLMADGVVNKENPKPMHYVVGEIYRVHTPNGTEQEVQLAVMDDAVDHRHSLDLLGTEALVNANGEIVDMTPEDTYAAIDICDIEFNFLDEKNVVCGLCGEVVVYATLFTGHLARIHPEMLEPDMVIGDMTYIDYLKSKLETDRKNIQNGFKFAKQSIYRKTPRKVSQIRINPSEMNMAQLEVALRKKLLEKMGRRVSCFGFLLIIPHFAAMYRQHFPETTLRFKVLFSNDKVMLMPMRNDDWREISFMNLVSFYFCSFILFSVTWPKNMGEGIDRTSVIRLEWPKW